MNPGWGVDQLLAAVTGWLPGSLLPSAEASHSSVSAWTVDLASPRRWIDANALMNPCLPTRNASMACSSWLVSWSRRNDCV
jgi:hypothetical protein